MAKELTPIFINHRKLDTESVAEHLARALGSEFGEKRVFLDRPSIEFGQRWPQVLEESAKGAKVMLALIGARWTEQDPKTLQSFLFDPNDWVRKELEWALAQGVTVIPVLVEGIPPPPIAALQQLGALAQLPLTQGANLRTRDWDNDLKAISLRISQLGIEPEPRGKRRGKPTKASAPKDDDFAAYRQWLRKRHDGIELKGVGSGDIKLPLNEVFVPIRLMRVQQLRRDVDADGRDFAELARHGERAPRDLFIEDVFTADPTARHALSFGEPGTGKTTALRKLLLLCLDEPARIGGLDLTAPGPLPVLLPLRRLRQLGTDKTLAEVIGAVLHEQDPKQFAPGIGQQLWRRGQLLLLLDGFDEVADETLYQATAAWLRRELGRTDARSMRAVVTCRTVLEQKLLGLDFGPGFVVLDFAKLGPEQCEQLVRRWYAAASRQLPRFPMAEADAVAQRLIDTLNGADYASHSLAVLVGTPLLLTLLCVVALREGEMPKHRVTFYQRCLDVLLNKWRYSQHAERPLLELDDAQAVLRAVAHWMHQQPTRELSALQWALQIAPVRRQLNLAPGPQAMLTWFLRETGVMVEVADDQFGFMHLGVQEFLCAEEMALRNDSAALAARAGEQWWDEVALLHVGLRDRSTFRPWCEALLGREHWLAGKPFELLRQALRDAHQPDLGPLLAQLARTDAVEPVCAVLDLLAERTEPVVVDAARKLLRSDSPQVQRLAQRVVDWCEAQQQQGQQCDVLVVADHAAGDSARELLRELRAAGMVPRWDGDAHDARPPWLADLDEVLKCKAVLVIAKGKPLPSADDDVGTGLQVLQGSGLGVAVVRWGKQAAHAVAWATDELSARDGDLEAVLDWVSDKVGKPRAVSGAVVLPGAIWVEPLTGIRFVWIAGGEFQMGSKEEPNAQPIRPVRVPGFWLAETPVTNEQYAKYLGATKAEGVKVEEPEYWRDKKWSEPRQPVVGVSWQQAQAFCEWLAARDAPGVRLPSEAEWEFAARAGTTTRFHFGDRDEDLVEYGWFDQNSGGSTHEVRAKQPNAFGLYDMHGNVWEWCLDAWEDSYKDAPTDGSARTGEGSADRVVRGGSWFNSARVCRSAFRIGLWPDIRFVDLGFRPARSSPDPFTASPRSSDKRRSLQ